MSEKKSSEPKEDISSPPKDLVLARLENFHVLRNARARNIFGWIPALLLLLVLTDWLIGMGTFSRDIFRMTTVLMTALVLFIVQILFESLPKALETIWQRELIDSGAEQGIHQRFLEYLDQFQASLNAKYELGLALLCAIGGLFATYPFRYLVKAGYFPYDFSGMLVYYFGLQAAFIAPVLGLILGAFAWRIGVIATYIGKIGERFPLKIQLNHSDHCGGFKPLGDLTFKIAAILIVPSVFLAVWTFIYSSPLIRGVANLWGDFYRQLLVTLIILSFFVFIQPLYKIHLRMEANARKIRGELDDLSREIERLSYELRSQAINLTPQQGEEKLRTIEFMKRVYEENSRIPTWPFDWKMVIQFSGTQLVPLLSLLGTNGPIVEIVKGLFSFGK